MSEAIFISYRRKTTGGSAGRLWDRLKATFGPEMVFFDVKRGVRLGEDFVKIIQNKAANCAVLIAVIGNNWVRRKPPFDKSPDFVRVEITTALGRDIPVIPVLVDGAPMPRE